MIAIRLRGGWLRPVVLACVVMTVTSGCGLSAELDRERDPARTAVPLPGPGAVRTDGSGALRIDPSGLPSPVPSPSSSTAVPGRQGRGCPASGVRFGTGAGDAAMGLRVLTLTLTNCGKRPYEVDGYPEIVAVLGPEGAPIDGVRIVRGTDEVPMAPADPGPKAFTLRPGGSARASLYWRMAAEEGAYLRVSPRKGRDAVTLPLPDPLDIGPENTLGASVWVPAS